MTAWASVDLAVEAMRRGARDFVQKPWDNARLLAIMRTQTELGRASAAAGGSRRQPGAAGRRRSPLLAESAAMRPVLEVIARVGPSDANVLLTGENGTGKRPGGPGAACGVAARDRPIVMVNAGGISEGVFESELFGHVRAPSPTPRYFSTGTHDDVAGTLMAYGAGDSRSIRTDLLYGLSTSGGMLILILAVLAGTFGAVTALAMGGSGMIPFATGFVVAVATLAIGVRWAYRGATRNQQRLTVRFPTPPSGHGGG